MFDATYGAVDLGEVCLVIPAYEEEHTIAEVLERVPKHAAGLVVTPLVVVDGGHDRTAEVAAGTGTYTCVCAVNRGQGAALRLGYRLARERGAAYIAIVDADGQWDPAELAVLLRPLVDGEADFVQGSRQLGLALNADPVRAGGVRVFAGLVSLLTGTRVTDTSSGFRAFRAEVVDELLLEQDQYQSSELLIGVILAGWRLAECPVTMRARIAGSTKKGGNLRYGTRYGRVVLHTWWRERRRRQRES